MLAEDVLDPVAGTLDPEETGDVALALGWVLLDTGVGGVPEGRKTDVDDDVEGAVVSGLEALGGIVVCMTLGGRLTVVDGCVVSWGGRVFELDTASACVVGTADEDASVPMIVNGELMSPDEPNTGMENSVLMV